MKADWPGFIFALLACILMTIQARAADESVGPADVSEAEALTVLLPDNTRVVAAGIDSMTGSVFEKRLSAAFRAAVSSGPVTVTPVRPDQALDRHGRQPALISVREEPVQLYLLREGLTRFTGFQDQADAETLSLFREAEARARRQGNGLWRDPWYAIFTAENAPKRHGFAVVEGVPLDIARTRNMVYLNFGADWRTDFTVGIDPKDLKSAAWADWDIEALAGTPLRVRGWMRPYNGAFMTVTSPDQIERLAD